MAPGSPIPRACSKSLWPDWSGFKLGSVVTGCGGEVLGRQIRRLGQKFDHALQKHARQHRFQVVFLYVLIYTKQEKLGTNLVLFWVSKLRA